MELSPTEAERLFTRVFTTLIQRWSDTTTFRRLAELGLPAAAGQVRAESYRLALDIVENPEYDQYFIDRKQAVEFLGGVGVVGESMARRQFDAFEGSVDAASIVFLHSAVDAAVTDLCRAAAILGPSDWEPFIGDRKVSLSQLKEQTADELFKLKLTEYIEKLERESLLYRVDRLFAICRPPAEFQPKKDFVYDRGRLEEVDRLRHDLVHGTGSPKPISDVNGKLEYLLGVGLHMWALLNRRYDVKLHPLAAFSIELPPMQPTDER